VLTLSNFGTYEHKTLAYSSQTNRDDDFIDCAIGDREHGASETIYIPRASWRPAYLVAVWCPSSNSMREKRGNRVENLVDDPRHLWPKDAAELSRCDWCIGFVSVCILASSL
jgi:hypothetical protein